MPRHFLEKIKRYIPQTCSHNIVEVCCFNFRAIKNRLARKCRIYKVILKKRMNVRAYTSLLNNSNEIPHSACLPNERIRSFGRQVRNDKFMCVEYRRVFGLKPENPPPPKCFIVMPCLPAGTAK